MKKSPKMSVATFTHPHAISKQYDLKKNIFAMEHKKEIFFDSQVTHTFRTYSMIYNLLKSMLNDCNEKKGKETP